MEVLKYFTRLVSSTAAAMVEEFNRGGLGANCLYWCEISLFIVCQLVQKCSPSIYRKRTSKKKSTATGSRINPTREMLREILPQLLLKIVSVNIIPLTAYNERP